MPFPPLSAVSPEEIAALAYQYYLDEGRPEGRAEVHWLRAETWLMAQKQRPSPIFAPESILRERKIKRPASLRRPMTPVRKRRMNAPRRFRKASR